MRAVVITRFGEPEVLQVADVESPFPSRGEILVRVRATAVNRADLLQRIGRYPAPPGCPPNVPGLEFAGEVEALGDDVAGLTVGDRVFGLVGGGAYAEQLVTHARAVAKIPGNLAFTEAAAVPEAFVTAYDALVTTAESTAGDTVLVHAAGSGVGTAAVQVAYALGAGVIATSRTETKVERALDLVRELASPRPATRTRRVEGIVVKDAKFAPEVVERTDGRGADVVLDLVGGAYVSEDVACMAPKGRIVVVGLVAGTRADVDLGTLLRKRITIVGTVLRSRPIEEKIALARVLERRILPLFDRGVRAVVDRIFPLADAAKAHRYVADNGGFGKVILEV